MGLLSLAACRIRKEGLIEPMDIIEKNLRRRFKGPVNLLVNSGVNP